MNYEDRLEKLASGEIKGVRLERSTEWITQVIATGFLFIGGIVRAAMINRIGEPDAAHRIGEPDAAHRIGEPDAAQLGLPVPDPVLEVPDDVPDLENALKDSGELEELQPAEDVPRRGRPRSKTYPSIEPESGE